MPQIYTVDLIGMESAPPGWLGVLDDSERERADRYFHASDRLAYVAAHALKRLALAQRLPGRSPKALRFIANPFGKPLLAEWGAVEFNLSHTRGLVALAMSFSGPVGIDVETLGSPTLSRDLMQSVLTPAERAAVKDSTDWERAFLDLWTAKEAAIKAEGKGLSQPLSEIEVHHESAVGPSRHWCLWRSQPTSRHVLALAWCESDDAVDNHALCADDLTAWTREEVTKFQGLNSMDEEVGR